MKRRFVIFILVLLAIVLISVLLFILSAQNDQSLFDGKNDFNPNDSYNINDEYWEVSIGNIDIEWSKNIQIPHDAGYIGLYRQTWQDF